MGLNLKLVGTDKRGEIVSHGMHGINFTKNAQIFFKCLSITYLSFTNCSSFIDLFCFQIIHHTQSQIILRFHSHIALCSHSQTIHKDHSINLQSFMFAQCSQSLMFINVHIYSQSFIVVHSHSQMFTFIHSHSMLIVSYSMLTIAHLPS